MIKLLCCSDTHGSRPPKLDETDATAWLHAGDVYNLSDLKTSFDDTKDIEGWVKEQKLPVFAVRGNHDCPAKAPFFDNCEATGHCFEIAPGLLGLGLGWTGGEFSDLPTERDMQKVVDEAKREWVRKAKSGDQTLILTHYPPWSPTKLFFASFNPEGWMFTCIRELMDEVKPMVVVIGHIHELFGVEVTYNGADFSSLVVAPGPEGGILSIDKDASAATFEFMKKRKKKK